MFPTFSSTKAARQAAALNHLGLIRPSSGDQQRALADFEEAIRTYRDYPEAWNNAGIVLQH